MVCILSGLLNACIHTYTHMHTLPSISGKAGDVGTKRLSGRRENGERTEMSGDDLKYFICDRQCNPYITGAVY